MSRLQLVLRGLRFHWRTHAAVIAGVAAAVAVLAGALLVGDSVRGSLRALVVERLGRTDLVVVSPGFFTEQMAAALAADPAFAAPFSGVAPLVAARGVVTAQEGGRRAGAVAVYGVDDRFWRFHGRTAAGPADRAALVSPALAAELQLEPGTSVLVRVQRPTDVPIESLHGRKDDVGRTVRVTVSDVLPRESLGEFSLEPQQGEVRAVFVPLARLQQELEAPGRVNTLLVSRNDSAAAGEEDLRRVVRAHTRLEDIGLRTTIARDRRAFHLESDAGLINDRHAEAARVALRGTAIVPQAVFTYLANGLRAGDRTIPYSLVTAVEPGAIGDASMLAAAGGTPPIVLTRWAADDLRASVGQPLTMEYYLWEEPGRLVTHTAEFRVAGIVPLEPSHRELAPTYPGISDSPTLEDWDPPFPIDLRRIRPVDEAFWNRYRTTPKAYIAIGDGQRLWRSRHGSLTSLRMPVPEDIDVDDAVRDFRRGLREALDTESPGPVIRDVRSGSLAASAGATDFGEYFVYFSFFLVVSALLLAALFFKLGVEGRVREVGLMRAVGFGPGDVRRLFLAEGLVLAIAGSLIGAAGAVLYASLLMAGLRTWWVDAVGTTALQLHVRPVSLLTGAIGGIAIAAFCIWWTLRSLGRISERSLLAEDLASLARGRTRTGVAVAAAAVLGITGAALVAAGAAEWIDAAGAFFGAGFALLTAALAGLLAALGRRPRQTLEGGGWSALPRLGLRNAGHRPARSVLAVAVIAAATFILISVDAFRRDGGVVASDRGSGLGGYALVVETLLPIAHDPNTAEGREALNLFDLDASVRLEPFRLRPGEDASCLNLYAPSNPRILAPRDGFLAEGRFAFTRSLARTDAERENPWLLLQREEEPGVVPVIADANSMTYVLHRQVGDEMTLDAGGTPVRLRFVAALRDSIFQSELIMSEAHFERLFPAEEGYRVLLVDAPVARSAALAAGIEGALSDLGADATTTGDRLAQFHRVENTYLSTFQTLGGLGLLLGTVGLAAVLLRNVMERRRELALLGAVGYRRVHLVTIVVAENVLLLAGGLAIGAVCAAIAIAPAIAERGGRLPLTAGGGLLLFAVLAAGLLSSLLATRAATRAPLLASLRSE